MKRTKILSLIFVFSVITTSIGYFNINEVYAANEQAFPIKDIPYNLDSTNSIRQYKSVFTNTSKLQTSIINEDAGVDKKITKVVFLKDDKVVKTEVVNARYLSKSISFNGEKVLVTSKGNSGYGTWFAWQRYSIGSRGNFWYPGQGNYKSLNGDPESQDLNKRCGPPYPAKETILGQKMDMYPGCYVQLTVSYPRSKVFKSSNYDIHFPTGVISAESNVLMSLNKLSKVQGAENPEIDWSKEVEIYNTGKMGKPDYSTEVMGISVKNLDEAEITFRQYYDHVGLKENLPATGAAMMYYFGAFIFDIQSYTYRYPNKMQVFYTDGGCVGTNCGGGGGGDPICTVPVPGNVVSGRQLDPKETAAIRADDVFDVLRGIPTSETLNVRVLGAEYLFEHEFVEMSGTCEVPVTVSKRYVLYWDPMKDGPPAPDGTLTGKVPDPQYDEETITEVIKVKRPYSYWVIKELNVYDVDRAAVTNYALPGEKVELTPDGYVPKSIQMERDEPFESHVYMPTYNDQLILADETLQGGQQRPAVPNELALFQSVAEKDVPKLRVKNDQLTFDGKLLMTGIENDERGARPEQIPQPSQIGPYVLYQDQLWIYDYKPNVLHASSTGSLSYTVNTSVHDVNDLSYSIASINSVTVHTPTVIYAQISDDKPHNQKTKPNAARAALILGRAFVIAMPTDGQHAAYPGYGYRDYAKYMARKEVRFPFDTYTANDVFLPKGTWYSIPVAEKQTAFKLPVWVNEGDYTVEYRTFAENAPSSASSQRYANTNLAQHAASDSIEVEVIGRLYDFRITDITDVKWEQVFRVSPGSHQHTGNVYWTGLNDVDGNPRGQPNPYTLPIRPGSHPAQGYQNVSVKTGYTFRFDLKTIGNMFGPKDMVRIKPSFIWVDEHGGARQAVDVYKHTADKLFVKLGASNDSYMRQIALQERLRNVPDAHIAQTAQAYYELYRSTMTLPKDSFVAAWQKRAAQPADVGGYTDLRLGSNLRTYIGPPTTQLPDGVDPSRALASIQQWYGEYHVPSQIYIVPKGFDLSKQFGFKEDAPFLLKKGYLIVNFDIETVRDGDVSQPHLQYIHAPLSNQWKREGYVNQVRMQNGAVVQLTDGDVVFYHGDKSAQQDYRTTGTH